MGSHTGQGLCWEEAGRRPVPQALPTWGTASPSRALAATSPTCCLQKGVSPPCPVLRALPELHFWDNSTPLGLAPCQLPPALPDSLAKRGGPASLPAPRTQHQGRVGRRQRRAAPVSPLPTHCHTHPSTALAGHWAGRCSGRAPSRAGARPTAPSPMAGQPHGYFWMGWREWGGEGQAGREEQWGWFCHQRGI